MKTRNKPKILCLGMSYADIEAQMKVENFRDGILINKENGVPQVVECVRRHILTEMDGRDLARCVAMEKKHRVEAYTVSQERGAAYDKFKHLSANFNRPSFSRSIKNAFGEDCQFQQIILDYFWIPKGAWVISHWSKALFRKVLPDLASLLESTEKRCSSSLDQGVIFLPFCFHVFKEIVAALSILSQYYQISFVRKKNLRCHALWSGTQAIDPATMQERLGKKINQEEAYCTFSLRDVIQSMEDSTVRKDEVIRHFNNIEDIENVRMIRLKPINATQTGTGRLGGFMYSAKTHIGNVSVSRVGSPNRKFSNCNKNSSGKRSGARVVGNSPRKIRTSNSMEKKSPISKKKLKYSDLLAKKNEIKKKRRRLSVDDKSNENEDSRKTSSARMKSKEQQSKLYTIAEDLETYRLFDKDEEVSSYYEISNTSKGSLFPDFRRSYWDILNNEHVSRPHCIGTIQMMNTTMHSKLCFDNTRGNKYEPHFLARIKIQEAAAKLLLLHRQVQLYPCVHPKVVEYEDKEGKKHPLQEKNC